MGDPLIVSTPGRADFLNTHQDYKGLPVVPVAINLRMRLYGEPRGDRIIAVKSRDLESLGEPYMDEFKVAVNEMLPGKFFGNYLRGVVNVLIKRGLAEELRGANVIIESDIPVGSGLSSSAALEVGFTELLNRMNSLDLDIKDVAEISFYAENQEVGIPCGRLDQYGVAFGGIIKLECRPPYNVESLPFRDLVFTIVDSGVRHSTAEIHPKRQAEIDQGLRSLMANPRVPEILKSRLGHRFFEPKWEEIREEEIKDYLTDLDEVPKRRILFTLRMQKSTDLALKVLRSEIITKDVVVANLGKEAWEKIRRVRPEEMSYHVLGEVMNYQQSLLRDLYDVSIPKIDDICSAAIEAGAYGAKISGAGMGGSIIALVKDEKVGKKVIFECVSAGAKQGWISRAGDGVKVEAG
ncbi:MAG: galactokinase family protein [Nitrososphaerota archaeon]|nr:GHMP kinase [Candidatus Bathyarchaeota archaeon]MDW8048952.1 galactokinase family protein [Nitrososphaerota archaeon]